MSTRPLNDDEWAVLTPGLARALRASNADPLIVDQAFPTAYVAALWRGAAPVMTIGRRIWWPRAPADLSRWPQAPILQHELQHVLDYADGALSVVRYLTSPRHWTYAYDVGAARAWDELGAEQRASMAEDLWRAERGETSTALARALKAAIPWARET